LTDADLEGADLSKADLSEADLRYAKLKGADLPNADLSGADLVWADLTEAVLSGADLTEADLERADLSGADLSGADLSGADLSGADLSGANLSGANLSDANLKRTNLEEADLTDTALKGADFDAFFVEIVQGINLVSLPLMPTQTLTARDMLEKTDATLIIRYNTENEYFQGFTSRFPDTSSFPIEGGSGYIINARQADVIEFSGTSWTNQPPDDHLTAPPSPMSNDLGLSWLLSIRG